MHAACCGVATCPGNSRHLVFSSLLHVCNQWHDVCQLAQPFCNEDLTTHKVAVEAILADQSIYC